LSEVAKEEVKKLYLRFLQNALDALDAALHCGYKHRSLNQVLAKMRLKLRRLISKVSSL